MRGLNALDIVVIVAYLVGITLLGIWVGRRQRDAKDYFVADREIPWWAVMFSIVASETSALTFISVPGLAYMTNLGFLQLAFGYLVGRIALAYTLLPRYYEGNLVTAYALLEKRFGLGARRFTSIVFMVTRGMADSVRVFATAVPIALIIGPLMPAAAVMPVAVLVLGTLTIIYTIRGGMRAVVWTEIVQASVYLFGGAAAVVLVGHLVAGGWSAILGTAGAAHKLQIISWYTGFDQPHTVFAGVIGGAVAQSGAGGGDRQRRCGDHPVCTLSHPRHRAVGALRRANIPPPRLDLSDVHRRQDAAWPGRAPARRRPGRDDEHAFRRDQFSGRGVYPRYLSAAHRPRARRSPHAAHGPRVRADLGHRAHQRRAPLSREHQDAGGRRRPVDCVVHIRRPTRRLFSRYFLVAGSSARCDPRHVGRHHGNGRGRVREAAHRGVPRTPPRARP